MHEEKWRFGYVTARTHKNIFSYKRRPNKPLKKRQRKRKTLANSSSAFHSVHFEMGLIHFDGDRNRWLICAFFFFFFYLHTPDTVHTLWPWFTIFHCNVFQHESVMLNVAWFSGGPAVLQITLVCVTFKIWLFSYLKVNWFRCLIKDQIRLGGDLPPKRPHGCWDEKYVNIFFILFFSSIFIYQTSETWLHTFCF